MATFMSLAAEVRLQIYHYHLVNKNFIWKNRTQRRPSRRLETGSEAILYVCKQITAESTLVFWEMAIFNVDIVMNEHYNNSDGQLPSLSHVHKVRVGIYDVSPACLSKAISAMTSLECLEITDTASMYGFKSGALSGKTIGDDERNRILANPKRLMGLLKKRDNAGWGPGQTYESVQCIISGMKASDMAFDAPFAVSLFDRDGLDETDDRKWVSKSN